jgi:hypothetical protein
MTDQLFHPTTDGHGLVLVQPDHAPTLSGAAPSGYAGYVLSDPLLIPVAPVDTTAASVKWHGEAACNSLDELVRTWPTQLCPVPPLATLEALRSTCRGLDAFPSPQQLADIEKLELSRQQLMHALCNFKDPDFYKVRNAITFNKPDSQNCILRWASGPDLGLQSTMSTSAVESSSFHFSMGGENCPMPLGSLTARGEHTSMPSARAPFSEPPPWNAPEDDFKKWMARVVQDVETRKSADCEAVRVCLIHHVLPADSNDRLAVPRYDLLTLKFNADQFICMCLHFFGRRLNAPAGGPQ